MPLLLPPHRRQPKALLLLAGVVCLLAAPACSRHLASMEHHSRGVHIGKMLSKLRYALQQGVSGPAMSHEANYNLAKLQQDEFCRLYYPLDLVNTRLVNMGKFQINVYAEGDIVSAAFTQGQQWDSGHIQEVLWALNASLPDGAPQAAKEAPPVFLDIGANIGSFSLPVAAQGYQVLAVEGMPKNQAMLRQSICASGLADNITLYAVALGSQRSMCYMVSDNGNMGDGVMVCDMDSPEAAAAKYNWTGRVYHVRSQVMLHPLDSVLQGNIKVMKIDVEGHEPAVFRGAQRLISQPNVWFILLEHETSKPERWELIQDLERLGYSLSSQSFQGPFITSEELEASFKGVQGLVDLFAVRTRW